MATLAPYPPWDAWDHTPAWLWPPLTAAEGQVCWAAGLSVRAFNAKQQRLDRGPQLDRLASQAPERAARAGIDR